MPDGINRKSLARGLLLSERVGDKRLVREIRRKARELRKHGRTFMLPPDLDLDGCLAALARRLEDEQAFLVQIEAKLGAELDEVRAKFDARERQAWMRIWTLQLILHLAATPHKKPQRAQ